MASLERRRGDGRSRSTGHDTPAGSALVVLLALGLLASGCEKGVGPPPAGPGSGGAGASGTPARTAGSGSGEPASRSPWFRDVAQEAGIGFRHVTGMTGRFWFPEIVGSGVALFDFDGDGLLDIYFVQGGFGLDPSAHTEQPAPVNRLYRNLGGMKFADVTERARVGDAGYGMGATCGDYDNDGDVDLYVTNVGANVLYRNEGDGTFSDVTARAGVGDASWGTSCAFFDLEGDGDLDLIVTNYIRWRKEREIESVTSAGRRVFADPNSYAAPASDTIYRNQGDGTFVEVTREAGLLKAFGNGLGVATADFDDDGDIDIYVANDGNPNQLWLNDGTGKFLEDALTLGCAVNIDGSSEAGMGVHAVDIDEDGDLDIMLTHLRNETNTYYCNMGGWFEDATAGAGLGAPSEAYTGFGVGFVDFDADGWRDIYIANGRVKYDRPLLSEENIYAEPDLLFRSIEGREFREVLPQGGVSPAIVRNGRGAAFGDLDNDGAIDVVVVNQDDAPQVLHDEVGSRGNWILLRVTWPDGRIALHSRLGLRVGSGANGVVRHRMVQRDYSFCASNDPRVHCGLGAARQVDEIEVRWPDGVRERFGPLAAGREHTVVRGRGRPAD